MTRPPSTARTPRQPRKSPIRPETEAPTRFPVMEPISVRPIAIWRFSRPDQIAGQTERNRKYAA